MHCSMPLAPLGPCCDVRARCCSCPTTTCQLQQPRALWQPCCCVTALDTMSTGSACSVCRQAQLPPDSLPVEAAQGPLAAVLLDHRHC